MDFERFKKFLTEKGSPSEVQEMISWIHGDEAVMAVENKLLMGKEEEDPEEDFDAIYAEILVKIKDAEKHSTAKQEHPKNTATSPIQKKNRTALGAIAAALILLILSSYFILATETKEGASGIANEMEQPTVKAAAKGEKLIVRMSDGTRIKLNGGSSITYFANEFEKHRQVELEGEAFFDVFHDETHPFEVKVQDKMQITVLGTSFLINSYNANEQIVAVKTGKVAVKKMTNSQSIIITKDELVKVSDFQALNKVAIIDKDIVFGWIDNRLVLDNAPFIEVLNKVNQWFGYEIEVDLDYSNYGGYSASLSNPTLVEIMESLAHSYKFKYHIDESMKRIEIE